MLAGQVNTVKMMWTSVRRHHADTALAQMWEQTRTAVRACLGGRVSTAKSTQTNARATLVSTMVYALTVLQSTAVYVHPAGVATIVIRTWINALARLARMAEFVRSISSASEPTRARTSTYAPVAQDFAARTVKLTSMSVTRIRATTAVFALNPPQILPSGDPMMSPQALGSASALTDGWADSV